MRILLANAMRVPKRVVHKTVHPVSQILIHDDNDVVVVVCDCKSSSVSYVCSFTSSSMSSRRQCSASMRHKEPCSCIHSSEHRGRCRRWACRKLGRHTSTGCRRVVPGKVRWPDERLRVQCTQSQVRAWLRPRPTHMPT